MNALDSWNYNASSWIDIVRSRTIRSRAVATDSAIVAALSRLRPQRVLDVGCGEGWLMRRLRDELGCEITGVDGCSELIAASTMAGSGRAILASYAEIEARPECVEPTYDVAVCNFSLLDEEIAGLLGVLAQTLADRGALVIQTVHPWAGCGDHPYKDGWRTERFESFGTGPWVPMHWYYRTLGTWVTLLTAGPYFVETVEEPIDPDTGRPLSLLITARLRL